MKKYLLLLLMSCKLPTDDKASSEEIVNDDDSLEVDVYLEKCVFEQDGLKIEVDFEYVESFDGTALQENIACQIYEDGVPTQYDSSEGGWCELDLWGGFMIITNTELDIVVEYTDSEFQKESFQMDCEVQ